MPSLNSLLRTYIKNMLIQNQINHRCFEIYLSSMVWIFVSISCRSLIVSINSKYLDGSWIYSVGLSCILLRVYAHISQWLSCLWYSCVSSFMCSLFVSLCIFCLSCIIILIANTILFFRIQGFYLISYTILFANLIPGIFVFCVIYFLNV